MDQGKSKVIQLFGPMVDERDKYLAEVKRIGDELMSVSGQYGESVRAVLADLTYIVVGRDIMTTLESEYREG